MEVARAAPSCAMPGQTAEHSPASVPPAHHHCSTSQAMERQAQVRLWDDNDERRSWGLARLTKLF